MKHRIIPMLLIAAVMGSSLHCFALEDEKTMQEDMAAYAENDDIGSGAGIGIDGDNNKTQDMPDSGVDSEGEILPIASASEDLITYAVEGGNIYFDPQSGSIEKSDKSITKATIPNMIGGTKVTGIGSFAFSNCGDLTEVTIPEGVNKIDRSAFWYCISLAEITIPNGVTEIGEYSFSFCDNLKNVSIPDSVTKIGSAVFEDCVSLTDITIPNSVTNIGDSAFENCTSLKDVTLSDKLKTIPMDSFINCSSLTSISIPEGVNKIEMDAFSGCTALKKITIPSSVVVIDGNIFSKCDSLKTAGPLGSGFDYEFSWTEAIPAYAFAECGNLTSVVIPETVTSIGESAFANCKSLEGITIPGSVASMGQHIFQNCEKLKTAGSLDGGFDYEFSWTDSIPDGAFSSCNYLTSIAVPDTITSIGSYSFSNCPSLKSISIPDGVTSIGKSAFTGCSGLTGLSIPHSVTTIGESAFSYCQGLTSVTVPDSVTDIGLYAFSHCNGLETAGPSGGGYNLEFAWKEAIPDYAFTRCFSLINVTIPEGIKSIGKLAFLDCNGLTDITLPQSLENIEPDAFNYCDPDKLTMYVKKDSYAESFAKDNNWKYMITSPEASGGGSSSGGDGSSSGGGSSSSGSSSGGGSSSSGGGGSSSSGGGGSSSGGGGGGGSSSTYYTISFNSNGGSTVADKKAANNSSLTKPADPTRKGYKFTGWYTDKGCSTLYDFNKKVTSAFTLYAGWEKTDDTSSKEEEIPNAADAAAEENTDNSTLSDTVKITIGSSNVIIGDKTYTIDAAPYIQASSDSTLVPLRFVSVALLGEDVTSADTSELISWDAVTKTAAITAGNKTISFKSDSPYMIINGSSELMENGVKAEIKDGRMYIPFRALGTALGIKVDWEAETKTAIYKTE